MSMYRHTPHDLFVLRSWLCCRALTLGSCAPKTAATSLLELAAAAAGAGTPRRSRGAAEEKSDLELMWGYDESPASAQGKAGRRQQQLAVGRVAHDDVLPRIDVKLQVGQ